MQRGRGYRSDQLAWWKKLLVGLLPLAVLLLLVEAFFRVVPPHRDRLVTRAGFVEPDPDLIWRLRSNDAEVLQTNELGFRDRPYKADADLRVLLLGDSVSWGDGITDRDLVYPQRAEEILATMVEPASVEIINASVPGYSTFQHARYLELRGLALAPDVVVISFCLNDVVERYWTLAEYGGDNRFLGIDTRQGIPGMPGWAVRHSRACEALMRWLQTRSRDQQEYQVERMARNELSEEIESAWTIVLGELDSMVASAQSRDIPLLLVITPYRFQLDEPSATDQPQTVLKAWAARLGVPVVDLLPVFAETNAPSGGAQLFNDENHLSIAGHELAAAELASALASMAGSGDSSSRPQRGAR